MKVVYQQLDALSFGWMNQKRFFFMAALFISNVDRRFFFAFASNKVTNKTRMQVSHASTNSISLFFKFSQEVEIKLKIKIFVFTVHFLVIF